MVREQGNPQRNTETRLKTQRNAVIKETHHQNWYSNIIREYCSSSIKLSLKFFQYDFLTVPVIVR